MRETGRLCSSFNALQANSLRWMEQGIFPREQGIFSTEQFFRRNREFLFSDPFHGNALPFSLQHLSSVISGPTAAKAAWTPYRAVWNPGSPQDRGKPDLSVARNDLMGCEACDPTRRKRGGASVSSPSGNASAALRAAPAAQLLEPIPQRKCLARLVGPTRGARFVARRAAPRQLPDIGMNAVQ
jgi:hypothetical protein